MKDILVKNTSWKQNFLHHDFTPIWDPIQIGDDILFDTLFSWLPKVIWNHNIKKNLQIYICVNGIHLKIMNLSFWNDWSIYFVPTNPDSLTIQKIFRWYISDEINKIQWEEYIVDELPKISVHKSGKIHFSYIKSDINKEFKSIKSDAWLITKTMFDENLNASTGPFLWMQFNCDWLEWLYSDIELNNSKKTKIIFDYDYIIWNATIDELNTDFSAYDEKFSLEFYLLVNNDIEKSFDDYIVLHYFEWYRENIPVFYKNNTVWIWIKIYRFLYDKNLKWDMSLQFVWDANNHWEWEQITYIADRETI